MTRAPRDEDLFENGGVMTALYRAVDWSRTPLGPVPSWPRSLKTCVRIVLTSRQPMFVWWGDDLVNLHNDAYRSILGGKHPTALGQPASVVWREIWDQVGPRAESAMRGNAGTYDEALLLIMERHGYPEETYYTFSYSPVPNDEGGTGGLICANTDDTQRIVGERQLALLRDLAARTAEAKTTDEACTRAALALATNPRDVPFALLYLADPGGGGLSLAATAGIDRGHAAAPVRLSKERDAVWPVGEPTASNEPRLVEDLGARFAALPTGAWGRPPSKAAVYPLPSSGHGRSGVLIFGLSPFRAFDDRYQGFLSLASGQVAASLANAQAYEEERKRAAALAELDRAKTTFFSNVSHEFRTPLTLMLSPLEEALASEAGAPSRQQTALIHRSGLRLLKLVNTLLDFARIEAGRVQASFEPVDLAALTADLASTFRSVVEKAGLRLLVEATPIQGSVYVDRDMWEKVVLNLLSNAFKFTFEGEIAVSLRDAGNAVELSVRDSGVGVPAAELPRLFERFHRVEGARGRTYEGSGIGLALVQELVKLHGGTIGASSVVGGGTTFTVRIQKGRDHLPPERVRSAGTAGSSAARAQAFVEEAKRWLPGVESSTDDALSPSPDEGDLVAEPSNERRARILLADDNADMRDYVRRLLSRRYVVEAVADGEAALAAIERGAPDLVLSDVMMPRLDGFGLVKKLRSRVATQLLPIVLLSARAGEEARVEGIDAGADDYLTKPFSARELMARVATHLELARVRREARQAIEQSFSNEQAARARAEDADRRKDEFLAMLAHELRNPLSPILNAAALLKQKATRDPSLVRVKDVIERQALHLTRLVDDLLEVSRVTSGKIRLERERVEARTIVARAVEASRPRIEARKHTFSVALPDRPLRLDADPVRIAQVLTNLLTNAAKYTDEGGRISLTVERDGADAVFVVRDNGVGIEAEMLSRVFDLFVQVDRSLDRSQGGLGIGLTLVRSIVEMHGGTVRAESAGRGKGTSVTVRLAASAEEETRAVASPTRREPSAATKKILVVDDNVDSAVTLGEILEEEGHQVRLAHDGLAALEAARELQPEVVLLDVGLPKMSGLEVARRLRESHGPGVLLVALTGYGQEEDRRRTQEAGFDHHMVKPPSLDALHAIIERKAAPPGQARSWTLRYPTG